jgi:hypothetical protein
MFDVFPVLTPMCIGCSNRSPYNLQPEDGGMPQGPDIPPISVLIIDSSKKQRTYWADQLNSCSSDCSSDYDIFEAADVQSGLALYRSRRIDCVVLELSFPDQGGFKALVEFSATREPTADSCDCTHADDTSSSVEVSQGEWGLYMLGKRIHDGRILG